MHHLLAGTQIGLTYLQDHRALAAVDWVAIFDDLADEGTPLNHWRWCDLDGLTHIVLATDRETGRYAGVLGLTARGTKSEPWLLIETALVRPDETNPSLLRAMLAHALVRIVCLDGKPAAFVASGPDRIALSDLGMAIASTTLHPPAAGNIVAFAAAKLARETGKGRTLLDLRSVTETALLRDLRSLHKLRRERGKLNAPQGPMGGPARNGGATRRPRKATRTGRSG